METTEAVRQEILEILDGYFRYTLLLSLPKDIPAAADDLAGLFAKKVKALTEALDAATHDFDPMENYDRRCTWCRALTDAPQHQTPERVLGQEAS